MSHTLLVWLTSGLLALPGSLLAVLQVPHRMPGIELGSALCEASTLPAVLSLWPLNFFLVSANFVILDSLLGSNPGILIVNLEGVLEIVLLKD